MVVTYDDNGVPKIMESTIPHEVKDFEDYLKKDIHKHSVRKQITEEFKKLCGNTPSDNTIGWALEEIKNKHFNSTVSNIQIHWGKEFSDFNVKWK